MPIDLFMTQLSPTMTEGRIARWLKAEGDELISGAGIVVKINGRDVSGLGPTDCWSVADVNRAGRNSCKGKDTLNTEGG